MGEGLREEPYNIGKFRCRIIYNNVPGLPIVLLHGFKFSSDVWLRINLLEFLEENKIPFVAIDMPYGMSSKCSPKTRDPLENVRVVREVVKGLFGNIKPMMVGASLGGYIALKYAVENPVAGLVLVGPVNVFEKSLAEKYGSLNIPVLIIWGEKDRIVSRNDMIRLSEILDAQLITYKDAGHAAYLDRPDDFKKNIMAFHKALKLE